MAIQYPRGSALGTTVQNFPKEQYNWAKEITDVVNGMTGGTGDISVDDLTVAGVATFNGTIVLGDAAADSLTVNATATYSDPINYSNATGITAFATGGQASATALTEEINNITTCATAGDSVKLPAAVAGKTVIVKNSGAAALDIFPASADSIDALAINLAVRIQPGSTATFRAKDAIVWESNIDETFTLMAPTTNTGAFVLKAVASAGNFTTTLQNASQAAARVYTIPDAGANASVVMTEGAATINGVKTFGDVTDSTSKDTGGLITQGGVGIEKSIFAGLTVNAGTALTVGTNITLAKEVDHNITVTATTTADTDGGDITMDAGAGLGTGNGGTLDIVTGRGGDTGAGGNLGITSGDGGGTSGASGDIALTTGGATSGGTGDITLTTGTTASGLAGDIIMETGVGTSTTVCPIISLNKGVVRKPLSSTVASGGTITGVELVKGLIDATGATGNWQLPSCADITTAIGSTPTGTNFEFVFNAAAMTATNTATLVVGAGMTVASAPAITGGGTLTVTEDTQVTGGFRIVYDSATTCKIYRIW